MKRVEVVSIRNLEVVWLALWKVCVCVCACGLEPTRAGVSEPSDGLGGVRRVTLLT